jgi:hypothetical protein
LRYVEPSTVGTALRDPFSLTPAALPAAHDASRAAGMLVEHIRATLARKRREFEVVLRGPG